MKSMKKILIIGLIALLCLIALVSIQSLNSLKIEDVLTDEFFREDTILSIEKINNTNFTEIPISKRNQQEIKGLLKEQILTRTDNTFNPLDAGYRIGSSSNTDDQIYIFVSENVIVIPSKSSSGYSIKDNKKLIQEIELLLK